jgi:hypothetical protein
MDRTVWIIIAVVALAVAGFFGYKAYKNSGDQNANTQRASDLQKELEASRLAAKDANRKADQEAEARRLAELKQKQEAEAESRRLAQSQSERDGMEAARKRAEDDKLKAEQEIERMRGDKARLEAEARRLQELRTQESADAQAKLAAAQKALEDTERRKNAEIERQAALIASYSRQPSPVEKPAAAAASESSGRRSGIRYIYPIDYKRANHTYVPALATPENTGN